MKLPITFALSDFLLACLENNIIMENRKYNMNYDPSELPKFQSCLDEAMSIVFGRAVSVSGIRFLMKNILVSIHTNDFEDSLFLPYECVTGTTTYIVDCIHHTQTEKQLEQEKRERLRKDQEEKHERDIYERLRKKFEKVD